VLESKGFTGVEVHPGPLPDPLNGLVGVPTGFAVSATR
jgi:hypothetical protein